MTELDATVALYRNFGLSLKDALFTVRDAKDHYESRINGGHRLRVRKVGGTHFFRVIKGCQPPCRV